jgi:signal transduction histidine kinase
MLSDLISQHRAELITRCQARVAERMAPRPTAFELTHGIPLFLEQLADLLRSRQAGAGDVQTTAATHGAALLRSGFTIAQVVHDYGDVCQTITELAIERGDPISTEEFQALNLCLDSAIAAAVTEFGRLRERVVEAERGERATKDLGFLAHELRNSLATATLAFDALRSGNVGIRGSIGAVLERTLATLRGLVDGSLAAVRLDAGIQSRDRVSLSDFLQEVEISATMEAKGRGHQLTVDTGDIDAQRAMVEVDRQIFASILGNVIGNALKYTRPRSHVVLRALATTDRVRLEVEDQCGGLPPGKAELLFRPFTQAGDDHSGLGLGLAICRRGIAALGGTIDVRNMPGEGCVFIVELPRAPGELSRALRSV